MISSVAAVSSTEKAVRRAPHRRVASRLMAPHAKTAPVRLFKGLSGGRIAWCKISRQLTAIMARDSPANRQQRHRGVDRPKGRLCAVCAGTSPTTARRIGLAADDRAEALTIEKMEQMTGTMWGMELLWAGDKPKDTG